MQVEESERRLARSRPARVIQNQLSLPFRIEQVFMGLKLLWDRELGIDKNGPALERSHGQEHPVRIEKLHPAAPSFWIFYIGGDESGFEWIECTHGNHRFESRGGSVNEDIPKITTGLALRSDTRRNFA